mmetsp:Transcript_159773/g.508605  ORF Transcript_159773/g.508605 Transcript_159773/m.508605 type:complete len:211 (+) Transcript_159773:378-1010(+)
MQSAPQAVAHLRLLPLRLPRETDEDEEDERFFRVFPPFVVCFVRLLGLELELEEEGATATAFLFDSFASGAPEMVILITLMGIRGLSSDVGTFDIFVTTSMPLVIMPNTGCWEGPGLNQSSDVLFPTLRKICDPPLFGWPTFAIDNVPGPLLSREMCSSRMVPPGPRHIKEPFLRFVNEISGALPWPAFGESGSLERGQPNWHMKPSITR